MTETSGCQKFTETGAGEEAESGRRTGTGNGSEVCDGFSKYLEIAPTTCCARMIILALPFRSLHSKLSADKDEDVAARAKQERADDRILLLFRQYLETPRRILQVV